MKSIIAYIIIVISVFVIGVTGFLFYLKLKSPKAFDTSQLTPININGTIIKTTGAIPNQDASSSASFNELIKLSILGKVQASGFVITTNQYGVEISLYAPHSQNRQAALDWLKNNGFGDIPQNLISFINL